MEVAKGSHQRVAHRFAPKKTTRQEEKGMGVGEHLA